MKIYRSGSEILDLTVDKKTKLTRKLMGEDKITCDIRVTEPLDIQIGDYITFENLPYKANRLPKVKKLNARSYQYTIVFEGLIYNLLDKVYLNTSTKASDFYLIDTAEGFVDLLLENINSQDSGWTKGDIVSTERKLIYFDGDTCRNVLNKIAETFRCEFDIIGRQINFYDSVRNPTALTFSVGKEAGAYELTRENVDDDNTITRVYPYGASRNLDLNYRGGIPRRLIYEAPGGENYIENTSAGINKVIERCVIFEDIYPRFNGTVGTVEIIDGVRRVFTCPEIDFDLNDYQLSTPPKVAFLSGDLMGKEFEFSYDHALTRVTLTPITEEGDVEFPGTTFFPRPGDLFTFVDIKMPQEYIDAAELELYNTAVDWLNYYAQLRVKYTLKLDPRYIRQWDINLNIGDDIIINDAPLGINSQRIRVTGITKEHDNPNNITVEISNILAEDWRKKINANIQSAVDAISIQTNNAGSGSGADRAWVAENFAILTGDNMFTGLNTFVGDVHINGDIYQSGSLYETHVEHIYSANDLINVRDNAVGALAADEYAGLKILLADGTNNLMLVGDNAGVARVGWENGTLQAIATREDSPINTGVAVWDDSSSQFRALLDIVLNTLDADTINVSDLDVSSTTVLRGNTTIESLTQLTGQLYSPNTRTLTNDVTAGNIFIGDQFVGVGLTRNQIFGAGGLTFGTLTGELTLRANGVDYFRTDATFPEIFFYEEASFNKSLYLYRNIGSTNFSGGLGGGGWQITGADDNGFAIDSHATFDFLTVRKSFFVYELVNNQVRATNGSWWISDSAKVSEVYDGGSYYRLTFDVEPDPDTGLPTKAVPFARNDLIMCHVFEGLQKKYYAARVTSLTNTYINISKTDYDGTDTPGIGDTIVRMGNALDTDRQGALYITASDAGAPYIDVIDGVNTFSFLDKTKVRIGDLSNMTDHLFNMSGYGLYAENAYLRGAIEAVSGQIATWEIVGRYIQSNDQSLVMYHNGALSYIRSENFDYRTYFGRVPSNPNAGIYGTLYGIGQYDYSPEINNGQGQPTFLLTNDYKRIAGWNFDFEKFYDNNSWMTITSNLNGSKITMLRSGVDLQFGAMLFGENPILGLRCKWGDDEIFYLTGSASHIAGWHFDTEAIWTGTKNGTGDADLTLSNTGDYIIRSQSFNVKRDGTVEISGGNFDTINSLNTLATISSSEFKIVHDADNYVRMFLTDADNWGLEGMSATNLVFQLGSTNQIAGFDFNEKRLFKAVGESGQFEVNSTGRFFVGAVEYEFEWVDLSGLEIKATDAEDWSMQAWHHSQKLFGVDKYGVFMDDAIIYARSIVRKITEETSTGDLISTTRGSIIHINRPLDSLTRYYTLLFRQDDGDVGSEVTVHLNRAGTTILQAYLYGNENNPIFIRSVAPGDFVRVKVVKTGLNTYEAWEEYRR